MNISMMAVYIRMRKNNSFVQYLNVCAKETVFTLHKRASTNV